MSDPQKPQRTQWTDGQYLYMVDWLQLGERETITDDFSKAEAQKGMATRLDRTIKLLSDPQSMVRLTTYCPHCSPRPE